LVSPRRTIRSTVLALSAAVFECAQPEVSCGLHVTQSHFACKPDQNVLPSGTLPLERRTAMKVRDLIQSRQEVFSIADSTPVHEAARYLREKRVRAVGVLDNQGALAGIVSQSDISEKVAAENKCPAWMRVSEIMSTELVTVTPETVLEDCLRLMDQHGIFHLLVLDDKAGFRGLISAKDLLRLTADDHKARADMLEAFVFPQH